MGERGRTLKPGLWFRDPQPSTRTPSLSPQTPWNSCGPGETRVAEEIKIRCSFHGKFFFLEPACGPQITCSKNPERMCRRAMLGELKPKGPKGQGCSDALSLRSDVISSIKILSFT